MRVMRWEPLTEHDRMRRQMERMLGNERGRGVATETFLPNVEVYETDREAVVNVELPGLDPKDVSVEISEDAITVSGKVNCSSEIPEGACFVTERQYGTFGRTVPLPDRIKDQEAKATFKNGLLTVRAPLMLESKRSQPRKVPIETE